MEKKTLQQIKEEFADMLGSHDWTFEYSDDFKIWERGIEHRKKIFDFIKKYDKYSVELGHMYDEANPFNNNKTII